MTTKRLLVDQGALSKGVPLIVTGLWLATAGPCLFAAGIKAETRGKLDVQAHVNRGLAIVAGTSFIIFGAEANDALCTAADYRSTYSSRFAGLPALPALTPVEDTPGTFLPSTFQRSPIQNFFRIAVEPGTADTDYGGRAEVTSNRGKRSIIEHSVNTVFRLPRVEAHLSAKAIADGDGAGWALSGVRDPLVFGPREEDMEIELVIALQGIRLDTEGFDDELSTVGHAQLSATWSFTSDDDPGFPGISEQQWSRSLYGRADGEPESFTLPLQEVFRGTFLLCAGKTYSLSGNLRALADTAPTPVIGAE